jgi:hypothetical protein
MASYDKPNVQTLAEILSRDSDAQKLAWGELAIRKSNDYSVLYDNLTGKIGSGKAFIEHSDLKVTAGNEVIIPLVGGARGPGVQGAGDRLGKEKKLTPASFRFKVGRWWDGFSINSVAKNETIVGGKWDRAALEFLSRNLRVKKVDDMLMELRRRATARNILRPNNKASLSALRTADVFSTATVLHGVNTLTSLGGKPVRIGKSSAGAPIRQFVFLGVNHALESFRNSSSYLEAAYNADVRGAMNSLFTGDILPWNGNLIYNWDVEDPEDLAPAGCPLLPRAFLGTAITAGTTAVDITGGGNATNAADTEVQFFGYFNNAAYNGCEGSKIAADTSTERYVAILNLSGADAGKVMFASYKVNNGNKLTMFKRLGGTAAGDAVTTLGQITWGTGTYGGVTLATAAAAGSLVVEVNEYGVPFGYMLGLGEMAGVMGHGSIDGASAIAKRTEEHTNHDMDHAIGLETVFGSRAFQRIDGQPGGFALIECALPLRGFPTVS